MHAGTFLLICALRRPNKSRAHYILQTRVVRKIILLSYLNVAHINKTDQWPCDAQRVSGRTDRRSVGRSSVVTVRADPRTLEKTDKTSELILLCKLPVDRIHERNARGPGRPLHCVQNDIINIIILKLFLTFGVTQSHIIITKYYLLINLMYKNLFLSCCRRIQSIELQLRRPPWKHSADTHSGSSSSQKWRYKRCSAAADKIDGNEYFPICYI